MCLHYDFREFDGFLSWLIFVYYILLLGSLCELFMLEYTWVLCAFWLLDDILYFILWSIYLLIYLVFFCVLFTWWYIEVPCVAHLLDDILGFLAWSIYLLIYLGSLCGPFTWVPCVIRLLILWLGPYANNSLIALIWYCGDEHFDFSYGKLNRLYKVLVARSEHNRLCLNNVNEL